MFSKQKLQVNKNTHLDVLFGIAEIDTSFLGVCTEFFTSVSLILSVVAELRAVLLELSTYAEFLVPSQLLISLFILESSETVPQSVESHLGLVWESNPRTGSLDLVTFI